MPPDQIARKLEHGVPGCPAFIWPPVQDANAGQVGTRIVRRGISERRTGVYPTFTAWSSDTGFRRAGISGEMAAYCRVKWTERRPNRPIWADPAAGTVAAAP